MKPKTVSEKKYDEIFVMLQKERAAHMKHRAELMILEPENEGMSRVLDRVKDWLLEERFPEPEFRSKVSKMTITRDMVLSVGKKIYGDYWDVPFFQPHLNMDHVKLLMTAMENGRGMKNIADIMYWKPKEHSGWVCAIWIAGEKGEKTRTFDDEDECATPQEAIFRSIWKHFHGTYNDQGKWMESTN